jgi:hypothetical protein
VEVASLLLLRRGEHVVDPPGDIGSGVHQVTEQRRSVEQPRQADSFGVLNKVEQWQRRPGVAA